MITKTSPNQVDLVTREEVLYITLSRPDCRNAVSTQMIQELTLALDEAQGNGTVRVIVLRGAGGNFCAGGDVKEMSELMRLAEEGDFDSITGYSASFGRLLEKIYGATACVVAVLEGTVLGGGLGLACTADIAVAMSDARFGMPETNVGLVPAQIAPYVRRRAGESNARLLAVLGGSFDAEFAKQVGLVHFLVSDGEELDKLLSDLLRKVKNCAPGALSIAKQLMSSGDAKTEETPEELGRLFAQRMVGEEAREGTSAFIAKRKPVWAR